MSVTKYDILDFLRLHRHAVQASHSADGSPQAALVSFVVNQRLELFFDSFDSTRKVANLRRDPRIAFVIGGHAVGDERTVQYEGFVGTPAEAELEEFKRDYFAIHPDGLRRSRLPGIIYFWVRPVWIRYTDLNVKPPQIVKLEGAALHAPDNRPTEPDSARPYTELKEPWLPDMEREAVFNPFAGPQGHPTGRK